jgi:hypothetical protein
LVAAVNEGSCGGPDNVPFHTDATQIDRSEQFNAVDLVATFTVTSARFGDGRNAVGGLTVCRTGGNGDVKRVRNITGTQMGLSPPLGIAICRARTCTMERA